MIKKCELCRLEFYVNEKRKRDREKRFCSTICSKKFCGLNNKGKKRTDEYKKQLSIKLTGQGNPFFGKKHTNKTKELIGSANQWEEIDYVNIDISKEQREIFDGIMISDGNLDTPSRISSRICLTFKYKETLERIIEDLNCFKYNPIYILNIKDKRTNKDYINYCVKSNFNHTLLYEYNRWYKEGIKIVPKDIELTSLFCYWWYVMDGYREDGIIILCTDSYSKEDMIFLTKCFNKINLECVITTKNRLRFGKKETLKYFDYIKEVKIQKEYEYKFG